MEKHTKAKSNYIQMKISEDIGLFKLVKDIYTFLSKKIIGIESNKLSAKLTPDIFEAIIGYIIETYGEEVSNIWFEKNYYQYYLNIPVILIEMIQKVY